MVDHGAVRWIDDHGHARTRQGSSTVWRLVFIYDEEHQIGASLSAVPNPAQVASGEPDRDAGKIYEHGELCGCPLGSAPVSMRWLPRIRRRSMRGCGRVR